MADSREIASLDGALSIKSRKATPYGRPAKKSGARERDYTPRFCDDSRNLSFLSPHGVLS